MNAHGASDEIGEGTEQAVAEEERLGEVLGASESGPAGRQVENRPVRPLVEILRRSGLTP